MPLNEVPKDVLPTLVIGLGGTGFQVIKRLKTLFSKRYGNSRSPVRYLLIDTDLKSFLDDSLENNEKCQLRFGDGIKNTLDWAYGNSNFDWLPKNPPITPDFFTATDQGAGLVRPIGRLYLCKNAKLVYDTISTARNDLVDLHRVLTEIGTAYLENIDRHKVYIVGSLAGGTGCGTFLDIAVMISKIFNRDNTNVIGLFTLESCYDDKLSSDLDAQNRSKANCYAALKELEFYMSSIKNPMDERYIFKYNNIGEIKLEKKLLDICYLVENKNEMGGVLTNIEDIYDLCSLQLFQEIGTTLGSQLRADYANFLCKDIDPVLKKDRHFSTFSSSSMVFPYENLKKYCSYMFSKDILSRFIDCDISKKDVDVEVQEIIDQIDNEIDFKTMSTDFQDGFKINGKIKYDELKKKLNKLDNLDSIVASNKDLWYDKESEKVERLTEIINNIINSQMTVNGLKFMNDVLEKVETRLRMDGSQITFSSKYSNAEVNKSVKSIEDPKNKSQNKKILKGKEDAPNNYIIEFNNYIEQEFNNYIKFLYDRRYTLLKSILEETKKEIKALSGNINDMLQYIDEQLRRIVFHREKKYGGNIISREMVSKEYYDKFYWENYLKNKFDKTEALFKGGRIIDYIESKPDKLIKLIMDDFDDKNEHRNIIEILTDNAVKIGKTPNGYIKEELDTASKLAKPFWSAVKNPEVSWTECYYVGAIKDNNVENGFTIKPPEALDIWIRNQTGERSRQARYVKTTDPYSIDVIHIVMGACAAYLPDVRLYRDFYMKLLSTRIYPLHLNERYVGLDEPEKTLEEVFNVYVLAKAFGMIFGVDNKFFINIEMKDTGYKYIYDSGYIVKDESFIREDMEETPSNVSLIREELLLGEGHSSVLERINHDSSLYYKLAYFIGEIERKINKNELKEHIKRYISEQVSEDFIVREKINNKNLSD